MALGGIGAGSLEIRPDGSFANWTIYNNEPLFTGPTYPFLEKQSLFFLLRIQPENENPRLVLLQIEDSHGAAAIEDHEYHYMFPWLSAVDVIETTASFPFTELDFQQDGLPLRVTLRAWSPFTPGNVKDSALPCAYFDFSVTSQSDRPIEVELIATAQNAVGYDQPQRRYRNRRVQDGEFSAVVMENSNLKPDSPTTGSVTLASFSQKTRGYLGWEHHHPYYERLLHQNPLEEIDDTPARNPRPNRPYINKRCFVTLAYPFTLEARGESKEHTFALAWHFPNCYGRDLKDEGLKAGYMEDQSFPGSDSQCPETKEVSSHVGPPNEGHYYERSFPDSESVARYTFAQRDRLLSETERFHRTFFDSDLPPFLLDQINSQLNTFRTSSWLTRTGMFGVLEGLSPSRAFAGIATTDVAMYGQIATSLLFPELDRLTIELWRKFQNQNGSVIHSISCNSREIKAAEANGKRLDMPAQFSFMTLRAALWSHDQKWLSSLWPDVKRALDYVLRERDFNKDSLPDMEGVMCSYDNFPMYGVAPYVASQWLAAVALALKVARKLGDQDFVDRYQKHFERGRETLTKTTWNGRYFDLYSDKQNHDPEGHKGCMADQIIGDGARRQLGLPPVIEPAKAYTALQSVLDINYKFEQGLRNCQWPGERFLHAVSDETWIDQANTCWSGVELNFAAQLYYSGMHEQAEQVVRNVDQRYRKWGMYWDHQEFGGHYFRPMAALAIPNAFLGLSYDGETLRIAPARPLPLGRWCLLLPGAYGTIHRDTGHIRIELKSGCIPAKRVELNGTLPDLQRPLEVPLSPKSPLCLNLPANDRHH